MQIVPVIMCGGAGTRLWPASDMNCPKQFHRLISERSVFQETILRFTGAAGGGFGRPMIIANAAHADLVEAQLAEIGVEAGIVVLEPEARNTGAVAAMAAEILAREGSDRLGLLVPSDHYIARPDVFTAAILEAAPAAQAGRIVTFGIAPTHPETGFGYIQSGARIDGRLMDVSAFREKPDIATALNYLGSGRHYWNSGIFLFQAGALLAEFEAHAPDILEACRAALKDVPSQSTYIHPDKDLYSSIRAISFDYAVMEHTRRAAVLAPLDCGWSDIGTWAVISHVSKRPNKLQPVRISAENCFVHSADDILVALVGVENLVIVADGRRVLVAARDASQDVGAVVRALKADGLENYL